MSKQNSKNDITLLVAKLGGGAGEGSEEALNVTLLAATWFILPDPIGKMCPTCSKMVASSSKSWFYSFNVMQIRE